MSKQQNSTTEERQTVQKQEALSLHSEASEWQSPDFSAMAVQRALVNPGALRPTDVATLQRSHGNQFVQRLLSDDSSGPMVQRWSMDSLWEGTKSIASDAWEGTKNVASNTWEGTKNLASSAWEGTKSVAKNTWEGTKNVASSAWEGTKTIASNTWEGTKSVAKNTWEGTKSAAKKVGKGISDAAGAAVYHSDYTHLNAKQFRISRWGQKVLVELVQAEKNEEGNLVYSALGEVTGYENNIPQITMYSAPRSLGNWTPRVTHLNGMLVNPQEGIGSGVALHKAVNDALDQEAMLDQQSVDVLYTYSASRGFGTDVAECLKGKLYIDDEATDRQEALMMNAIRTKQRTTVSAHSRGTIKTDNAVRNVYNTLHKEFMATYRHDRAVIEQARREAPSYMDPSTGIDLEMATFIATHYIASEKAREAAMQEMDAYIQLIYAGNAVEFPSSALKPYLVVGKRDPISFFTGTYFGADKKVEGYHEFDKTYSTAVGEQVAEDIQQSGQ